MTKLSEDLVDAICGADECRGRDSQLTEWAERARALEAEIARLTKLAGDRLEGIYTDGHGNDISHLVEP